MTGDRGPPGIATEVQVTPASVVTSISAVDDGGEIARPVGAATTMQVVGDGHDARRSIIPWAAMYASCHVMPPSWVTMMTPLGSLAPPTPSQRQNVVVAQTKLWAKRCVVVVSTRHPDGVM